MGERTSASRVLHRVVAFTVAVFVVACEAATPTVEASNESAPSTATPDASRATAAPVPNREIHHIVVQAGQSLSRLAAEYHVPKDVIITANHLTPPYKIKIGEKLQIPGSDGTPFTEVETSSTTVTRQETRHIVVGSGQSLSRLAVQYRVPQDAIIAANHLTPPYKIKIGDKLVIPNAEAPPTPVTVNSSPPEVIPLDGPASQSAAPPTAATSPSPPVDPTTKLTALPVAEAAPPRSPEEPTASAKNPPIATEPLSSASSKRPAPATATAALAVAAAPPGVICPPGTTGMWSEDMIKKPVYICHRVQSQ